MTPFFLFSLRIVPRDDDNEEKIEMYKYIDGWIFDFERKLDVVSQSFRVLQCSNNIASCNKENINN